jgi:hypothetical protein
MYPFCANPKAVSECDDIPTACASTSPSELQDRHKNTGSSSRDPTLRDKLVYQSQSPCKTALSFNLLPLELARRGYLLRAGYISHLSPLLLHTTSCSLV